MRWPNDRRLAEEVAEIDLILGGHDHDYNTEQVRWNGNSTDLPFSSIGLFWFFLTVLDVS